MASNNVEGLLSKHLGNHKRRNDVLQVMSFPGLSVDNVGSIPGAVTSGASGGAGSADSQVANLSGQLTSQQTAQQAQLNQLMDSAPLQGSRPAAASNSSGSSLLGSFASSFLSSGFGLSPIFEGLSSLFGGGGSSQPAQNPLVPFSLPPSIQYAGGLNATTGSVSAADYGQNGQLRALGSGSGSSTPQSSPNVQIQVSAMDTQSFLDRSDDIAQAVKQAMLNSSSLNDVIKSL